MVVEGEEDRVENSAPTLRPPVARGGTVEKFIGDAVVGVLGVPATNEDDPLGGSRRARWRW
jgi:hypothetical protein